MDLQQRNDLDDFSWRVYLRIARRHRLLIFFLPLLAGLAACGNFSFNWNEEVALASGETIVVKRSARGKPFGEIGGPGGWETMSMTVEVVNPKRPDNPTVWSSPFIPILLDRDAVSGEWFMVVTFDTCARWEELGSPKLPYGQWNYRNGGWQRTELDQKLIGRPANLLTKISSSGEPDHTIASKQVIMSDRRIAIEYQQVYGGWHHLWCR